MQKIALLIAVLVSGILNAQDNYEKGMQKAFNLWATNPTEASNLFERIAEAESENWLPPYYAAQINIVQSFGIKDQDILNARLTKAQSLLDGANSISKDNPEILVLQALLYTAWVAFDGATYGMKFSGQITGLYAQAEQLAPDNPRVLLNKAEWGIGSARFFGQDTTPFCKDIERATELFANFKPESPFHPNWGKERSEQMLNTCNE